MKKAVFFFFLCLISLHVFAQEMNQMRVVGKGEYLPSEVLNRNTRDANGEVCAGLLIISDIDGLSFTAYNEVVKVNHDPGRDLLYIQRGGKGERRLLHGGSWGSYVNVCRVSYRGYDYPDSVNYIVGFRVVEDL